MSPYPRFTRQDQTLRYKIRRYPTTSVGGGYALLTPAQVDQVIQMAFDRWAQISNFKFEQVTDKTDVEIVLTFDSFANALLPAVAEQVDKLGVVAATQSLHAADSDFISPPVTVCFDDSHVWTTLANNPATPYHAILWAVKSAVEIFTAYDLLTAATHEFGHVLGLDHNSNANSVMQEVLISQSATTRYYLDPRPLHEVDCAALAARYNLVGTNGLPVSPPASEDGFVIVGSTFAVNDLHSAGVFKFVDKLSWGDRSAPSVVVAAGYGYNEKLGEGGYANLSLHLKPAQDATPGQPCVIGGGVFQPLQGTTGTVGLHTFEPGTSVVAVAGYEMSGQWGADASQGNVVVVGRFTNLSEVNHKDCDSLIYLVVSRAGESPKAALLTEVWTEIRDSNLDSDSKYVARQWGMSVASAKPRVLGRARTWPDNPPTTGFTYGNGMGYFYLSAVL